MAITKFRESQIGKFLPKYFNNKTDVNSGLLFYIDGSNKTCYPGSGTTVFDLSGNSRNGTLINGTGFSTDASGCFTFNGTNQYINFPHTPTNSTTSEHTLSAWFNWDGSGGGTDGRRFLIESYRADNTGTPWQFSLWVQSSGQAGSVPRMQVSSSPYQNLTGNTTIEANRWYNVTIVYSRNLLYGVQIYINGMFDSEGVTVNNNTDYDGFNVGSYRGISTIADNRWFSGKISEMKIYNKALTELEIVQNFNYSRIRHGV
jgi:MSHA biogenesis protein MshQ